MCQVIIAPSGENAEFPSVFLAGGITNCKDWQNDVIRALEHQKVTIFNPRRETFDITDQNVTYEQIRWEYERLEQMDIFSMYFCSGISDQPICMYELGRNILRMQNRFPWDWENRIIIGIEDGYSRAKDVIIQASLCAPNLFVDHDATVFTHAHRIKHAIRRL